VYLRKVEKVNGELRSVESLSFPNMKDPAKAAGGGEPPKPAGDAKPAGGSDAPKAGSGDAAKDVAKDPAKPAGK
jgi:hypothetical protein